MEGFGFVKVATGIFDVKVGDVAKNTMAMQELIQQAGMENVSVLVFPELSMTGYTLQDMFLRNSCTEESLDGLSELLRASEAYRHLTVFVGMPIENAGKLYNCAVAFQDGNIIAVIPKTYLPNYGEFYEKRWFASANDATKKTVRLFGEEFPFGTDIVIDRGEGLVIGCELCEDLWVNSPPSSRHTEYGATVIANLSASNDIATKGGYRRDLVRMQSAKCNCAYIYASAGGGESTADVVYGGHQLIATCGSILVDNGNMLVDEPMLNTAVIDLEKITNDRLKMNSYRPIHDMEYRYIVPDTRYFNMPMVEPEYVNAYPFVPSDLAARKERCNEILSIQAAGLATRLKKTGIRKSVIGVSGGLDSTLALLVTVKAYKMLNISMDEIVGITMPGFGTTDRTKTSAIELMDILGITQMTVDIKAACTQHLHDIGHPMDLYDVTYENVQARERTQVLMDVANKVNGIVIGTGDLSEIALGWCTYNGDHMSMYSVNSSIPKTLVKYLITAYSDLFAETDRLKNVLAKICDTVISPELLPPDENGEIKQSTEQSIGKYDLHDFFLYYYVRCGFGEDKIRYLAEIAFADKNVTDEQIKDTLDIFIRRFRQNQFKRNAMPDGPKVGSVALSQRGDWRMASDM